MAQLTLIGCWGPGGARWAWLQHPFPRFPSTDGAGEAVPASRERQSTTTTTTTTTTNNQAAGARIAALRPALPATRQYFFFGLV